MPMQDFKGTLTGTGTFTADETAALNSKAPKTDVIKGDGTAGRVLRAAYVIIANGTNPTTVKLTTGSRWQGDANGEVDNIAKDATSGVYYLGADGSYITILNTGTSGDVVAVLAAFVTTNNSGTALIILPGVSSGINLTFYNAAGGAVDLTTLVDTGTIIVWVLYLTSA